MCCHVGRKKFMDFLRKLSEYTGTHNNFSNNGTCGYNDFSSHSSTSTCYITSYDRSANIRTYTTSYDRCSHITRYDRCGHITSYDRCGHITRNDSCGHITGYSRSEYTT
eukprot:PhF_6_TR12872/c0_g1_i1/m.20235